MNNYVQYTFYPGIKISERHETILPAIGAFKEEEATYNMVRSLRIFGPLFVLLASLIDLSLAILFHTLLHPWKRLLSESPMVSLNYLFNVYWNFRNLSMEAKTKKK